MRNWIRTNSDFLKQFALLSPLFAGVVWFAVAMNDMQRELDARMAANAPLRAAYKAKVDAEFQQAIYRCMDRKGTVTTDGYRGDYGVYVVYAVCSK